MKIKSFYSILIDSLESFVKNPWIAIFPAIFYLLVILFSNYSISIQDNLKTSLSSTLWLIFYFVVWFVLLSSLSFVLIILSSRIIGRKHKIKLRNIIKFLFLSLISLIVFMLINLISYFSAGYIGRLFSLEINTALSVYVLIYLALILCSLIFLTFSSFFAILSNNSILACLKKSISVVRSNYIFIVLIGAALYGIDYFSSNIFETTPIIREAIFYLLIIPYLFIVLTRIAISNDLPTKR